MLLQSSFFKLELEKNCFRFCFLRHYYRGGSTGTEKNLFTGTDITFLLKQANRKQYYMRTAELIYIEQRESNTWEVKECASED